MTIKELIEKLNNYPQETKILSYLEEIEEYGTPTRIKIYTPTDKEKLPYSKTDKPQIKEPTLIIESSCNY